MCEPVTMAIMFGAASAAQAYGQRQVTKAQFGALATQRQAQNEEISGKAGREMGQRVKEGRAERSRLTVAGGEAGITGNSFAASLMDVAFQQDDDLGAIGQDARFAQRASEAKFQSALASVKNPGALETGLKIAVSAAGGYAAGLQIQGAKAGAVAVA